METLPEETIMMTMPHPVIDVEFTIPNREVAPEDPGTLNICEGCE